jgi:hypothetical protein
MRLALLSVLSIFALGLLSAVAQASSPPSISSESVSGVTSRRAIVEAQVNPGGLETTYEVWVAYANCQNTPPGTVACMSISVEKLGEGTIAAGSTDQTVSTTLKHLKPGYFYTYWVVATNTVGEAKGAHQSFEALPAPVVDGESVSGVTGGDATLEAKINPEGQSVRYQFQLVNNPSEYATELECPEPSSGPLICIGTHVQGALPIGFVPGDLENPLAAQPVSLDLASAGVKLKPDTTYHYRVIVAPSVPSEDTIEWEGPPVYGSDQTFTTSPPPVIESESVSHITASDATLEAQINTEGLETTYEFHLVGAYCEWPCETPAYLFTLPSGKLLGSFVGQSVSLDLNSAGVRLMPINTYWVTATNAAGTTEGSSHTFRSGEGVQPLNTASSSGSSSLGLGSGSQRSSESSAQILGSAISKAVPDLTPGKHLQRQQHAHRRHHGKHPRSKTPTRKHHRSKTARRGHHKP